MESTDQLVFARVNTPMPCQSLIMAVLLPLVVKILEVFLLVNYFKEAIATAPGQFPAGSKVNQDCPIDSGANVYLVTSYNFWALTCLASAMGAATFVVDLSFVFSKLPDMEGRRCTRYHLGAYAITLVNLVLHAFCCIAVANAVGKSTTLSAGISNFATIFIIIELDEKVAEALQIKILLPGSKRKDTGSQDAIAATNDPGMQGKLLESTPAPPGAGGAGDGEGPKSCWEKFCSPSLLLWLRYIAFGGAMAVYILYSWSIYHKCPNAMFSDCGGVQVLNNDIDRAATQTLLQGYFNGTGSGWKDVLPYICADWLTWDIAADGTVTITNWKV